ncbi:DUF4651 domain-containing protein [Streptococcus pacificus]|uniref:DUF4651 domain-containing protein n=1 Tax=Streptococcus pacificus TaxID=2740577 RepID=A0ABS0ZK48_9STRE|nr:DUF4651 domain-containing protein [Streptococcus pacificus]MBJ8326389.1 DUF4651 domain-containing protein [Streptococcus pacificus]
MKKKKFWLSTGLLLGTPAFLGLAAFLGHKKQVKDQKTESEILDEVRSFFASFGVIKVVYISSFNPAKKEAQGGVVFDDEITFFFHYLDGDINYKESEQ